jgi:hypothetical protein
MAGEREWTLAQQEAGMSNLSIVGNILRWENPWSLFCLIQVENNQILAFDSGQGLCCGAYRNEELVENWNDAPSWKEIFSFYGVENIVQAMEYKKLTPMDGEERMCNFFNSQSNSLKDKKVSLLTAASPCNEKCAGLLMQLASKSQSKLISVNFFAPYTKEKKIDFNSSLEILKKANIMCTPLLPQFISPETWIGYKDKNKALEWLKECNQLSQQYFELMAKQFQSS